LNENCLKANDILKL